jgi:hypothetical protein
MGMDRLEEWQAECIARFGWYAHYVQDDESYPLGVNYHTHGLVEHFQHPDLQIVMPADPELAHKLFCVIVDLIKDGEKFSDGQEVKYPAGLCGRFHEVEETGRKVLRLILPDFDGKFGAEAGFPFNKQMADLEGGRHAG